MSLHRLASSSFLHDSFAHLCTSSYALWTIAPQVEAVLGSGTFLGVYYLSGLAGNVLSFVYGDAITVGASSATFGLIGTPYMPAAGSLPMRCMICWRCLCFWEGGFSLKLAPPSACPARCACWSYCSLSPTSTAYHVKASKPDGAEARVTCMAGHNMGLAACIAAHGHGMQHVAMSCMARALSTVTPASPAGFQHRRS